MSCYSAASYCWSWCCGWCTPIPDDCEEIIPMSAGYNHQFHNTPPPPRPPEPSRVMERLLRGRFGEIYRPVHKEVGSGAFSIITLVQRLSDGKLLAAKCNIQNRGRARYMISDEYELLKKIRHNNIINVLDIINRDDYGIIIMDYFPDGSLNRRLEMAGSLPEDEVRVYIRQICDALACIHRQNIVHGDIKPSNIICCSSLECAHDDFTTCEQYKCNVKKYQVKIIDFGMSIVIPQGNHFMRGPIVGTLQYMAPEVIHYRRISPRCDMWSVGIMAYQLLTGVMPLRKRKQVVVTDPSSGKCYFDSPKFWASSKNAQEFIRAALNENVFQRLSSIEALQHAWLSPLGRKRAQKSVSKLMRISKLACSQCDTCYPNRVGQGTGNQRVMGDDFKARYMTYMLRHHLGFQGRISQLIESDGEPYGPETLSLFEKYITSGTPEQENDISNSIDIFEKYFVNHHPPMEETGEDNSLHSKFLVRGRSDVTHLDGSVSSATVSQSDSKINISTNNKVIDDKKYKISEEKVKYPKGCYNDPTKNPLSRIRKPDIKKKSLTKKQSMTDPIILPDNDKFYHLTKILMAQNNLGKNTINKHNLPVTRKRRTPKKSQEHSKKYLPNDRERLPCKKIFTEKVTNLKAWEAPHTSDTTTAVVFERCKIKLTKLNVSPERDNNELPEKKTDSQAVDLAAGLIPQSNRRRHLPCVCQMRGRKDNVAGFMAAQKKKEEPTYAYEPVAGSSSQPQRWRPVAGSSSQPQRWSPVPGVPTVPHRWAQRAPLPHTQLPRTKRYVQGQCLDATATRVLAMPGPRVPLPTTLLYHVKPNDKAHVSIVDEDYV